jgi:protein phosphatase
VSRAEHTIEIPELCLVVFVGPSGSGKSTFARRHFKPTEVISSDFCRGLVSDDENSQEATSDAFDVLHTIARKRLSRGLLTVVDATNVQPEARSSLVELAREHDVLPVAIVLNLAERLCQDRNTLRPDRQFGPHVIRNQLTQLRRSVRGLSREGFRYVYEMQSTEQVEAASITRKPLWNNRTHDAGPFDIIGDVHGCFDELCDLLKRLGYTIDPSDDPCLFGYHITAPAGRKVCFVGDLIDRGPKIVPTLRLAMSMDRLGIALAVPGNHEEKLNKKLRGKDVMISDGLAMTLAELETESPAFVRQMHTFIDSLIGHLVLDGGKLVVAHAGIKQKYIGRTSARVRDFCLYGETTGDRDEYGLPVRLNWAAEYRGAAAIVYGHTPVADPNWLNNTVNIDTGCVFGGKLTALRWPEREFVSVGATQRYAESPRPFLPEEMKLVPTLSPQHQNDDVLDIDDVVGKRIIETRLLGTVTIRQENAMAALEVMSRFAANPKWLIYLPPTMSPVPTSKLEGMLEHPSQAFEEFRHHGVDRVVCEEKHMGSRAVVIVCRDASAARSRFGVDTGEAGIIYTRTGRPFFDDTGVQDELLKILRRAIHTAGVWDELGTDWVCMDCELMPWSAKAQELLRSQYAAVGSAAAAFANGAVRMLQSACERYSASAVSSLQSLLDRTVDRQSRIAKYISAYRRYCWPVESVSDLKLAPFHLLASEAGVHTDCTHSWHLQLIDRIASADDSKVVMRTTHRFVDLASDSDVEQASDWWTALTQSGGEGMVVKPLDFVARGPKGLVHPAVKVRGPEYLRIIYGPEYDIPGNLKRLRSRNLSSKRSLAAREFALGIEALERFARREPLRRIHECVFGVLALESEPIDPRL